MNTINKWGKRPLKGSQEYLDCIEGLYKYTVIETEKYHYIGGGRFVMLKSGGLPMVIRTDMLSEFEDDLTVVLFTCHQAGLPTYDQSINGAAP
jgi:hypothetical protein